MTITEAECQHDWKEEYYGWECRKCRAFAAYGCEPWTVQTEEDGRQLAEEEYYFSHGYCEICGGEWGDGWSSCTCDDPEEADAEVEAAT